MLIRQNIFLRCQLSYFAPVNIWFHTLGDIIINQDVTAVNSEKISVNTVHLTTKMNELCCANIIVLTVTKNMTIPNGVFLRKELAYFALEYQ